MKLQNKPRSSCDYGDIVTVMVITQLVLTAPDKMKDKKKAA